MRWTRFVSALGRVGRFDVVWLFLSMIVLELVVSAGYGVVRGPGIRRSEAFLFLALFAAPVLEEAFRWALGLGRSGDRRTQGVFWYTAVMVVTELLKAPFTVVEPLKDHSALVICAAILVLRAPASAMHIVNGWLVIRHADRVIAGPSFAPFATIGLHIAINTIAILFWGRAVIGFVQHA